MNYTYKPKVNTEYRNKVVGKLIREYREKIELSQGGLSEKSGLSQQHISQLELGKRNIDINLLIELGLLLGFSLHDVQERLDNPPTAVTLATTDDLSDIQQFDPHISVDRLAVSINDRQVYLLWTPDNDDWVGFCRYSLFQQSTPFLDFVYVKEPLRQKGCGSALVEHWEHAMRTLGHEHVMLSVHENDTARFFDEKCGYHCVGSFISPNPDCKKLMYAKTLSN